MLFAKFANLFPEMSKQLSSFQGCSSFPLSPRRNSGRWSYNAFWPSKTLQWGQKLSHLMPSSHGATLPQWRESELHFTCNRLNAILHVSLKMSHQIYLARFNFVNLMQYCISNSSHFAVWCSFFLQFLCRYSAAAEANCIGMCHLLNRKSEIRYFYWQIVSFVEFVLRFKS